MRHILSSLLFVLLISLVGCSNRSRSVVFVTSAKFGLIQPDGSIIAIERISHEPGTRYGWSLQVTPTTNVTQIKEVFTLPPDGKWGPKPESEPSAIRVIEYSVSEDGREQTEVFEVKTTRSFTVIDSYAVAHDDPPGHYTIALYVNDIQVYEFQFDVDE